VEKQLQERRSLRRGSRRGGTSWMLLGRSAADGLRSLQEQQQLDKEAAARQRSETHRRLAREALAERARLEALEAAQLRVLRAAPPEAEARGDVAEARARSARNAGGAPRRACLLPPPSPCSSPLPPQTQCKARRQLVRRATLASDPRRVAYVETSNAMTMAMTHNDEMRTCVAAVIASVPVHPSSPPPPSISGARGGDGARERNARMKPHAVTPAFVCQVRATRSRDYLTAQS